MSINQKDRLYEIAVSIVNEHPQGIRHKDLLQKAFPILDQEGFKPNKDSLASWLSALADNRPNDVTKPSRGLFIPAATEIDLDIVPNGQSGTSSSAVIESDYYDALRDFLINELNECIYAESIGAMRGGGRWGNPDVVGINKPKAGHVFRFSWELITAELKTNSSEVSTAFGQASSYNLFSHKVYVAIPKETSQKDLDRLLAQCHLAGMGVLVFTLDTVDPSFEVMLRARASNPDMFYVNQFADLIKSYDPQMFNRLFG